MYWLRSGLPVNERLRLLAAPARRVNEFKTIPTRRRCLRCRVSHVCVDVQLHHARIVAGVFENYAAPVHLTQRRITAAFPFHFVFQKTAGGGETFGGGFPRARDI